MAREDRGIVVKGIMRKRITAQLHGKLKRFLADFWQRFLWRYHWADGIFYYSFPQIRGGAGSAFALTGSRIANSTRTWQALEDADVTGWTKTDDFIFAAMLEGTGHSGASGTVQLRWRDVTDAGSFAVLSGTGELTWSGTTDLVNGNAVTSGEAGCTPIDGDTWQDGVEREGANDISSTLGQAVYSEYHWAIDSSSADDSHQYEFDVYDSTAGASIGTCLADITMEGGAVGILDFERGIGRGAGRGIGRGVG